MTHKPTDKSFGNTYLSVNTKKRKCRGISANDTHTGSRHLHSADALLQEREPWSNRK